MYRKTSHHNVNFDNEQENSDPDVKMILVKNNPVWIRPYEEERPSVVDNRSTRVEPVGHSLHWQILLSHDLLVLKKQ